MSGLHLFQPLKVVSVISIVDGLGNLVGVTGFSVRFDRPAAVIDFDPAAVSGLDFGNGRIFDIDHVQLVRIDRRRGVEKTLREEPLFVILLVFGLDRRRALIDLVDVTNGPLELVGVIDKTEATELPMLRERIMRAARSGDWTGMVPETVAAE